MQIEDIEEEEIDDVMDMGVLESADNANDTTSEQPSATGSEDYALNNNEDSAMDEQSTDSDEPIGKASFHYFEFDFY